MITDPDNNAMPANTAKDDSEADRMPVEEYSPERKAEFLLSNALGRGRGSRCLTWKGSAPI